MISETALEGLLTDVDVVSKGSGQVVALAHGAGGGVVENFTPLMQSSGRQFRFVGPNYPGVGTTPPRNRPLALEELADTVVAAAQDACATQFPIIGLSLGCAVAITAATRYPELVTGLVLTVGFSRPDAQSSAFVAVWRALAASGDLDSLAELMLHAANSPATLAQLTLEQYRETTEQIRAGYPVGGASHAELVSRTDVSALMGQLDVPTLVIVAGQDRIVLPDSTHELARAIPGAELVEYPDAGHIFTPVEGQRWAGDVEAFLRRIAH